MVSAIRTTRLVVSLDGMCVDCGWIFDCLNFEVLVYTQRNGAQRESWLTPPTLAWSQSHHIPTTIYQFVRLIHWKNTSALINCFVHLFCRVLLLLPADLYLWVRSEIKLINFFFSSSALSSVCVWVGFKPFFSYSLIRLERYLELKSK